jgi:alpha-glucuronidase
MVTHYDRGVDAVKQMRSTWDGLSQYVDPERHAQVAAFLAIQQNEAQWWRDASIAYWQSRNGLPLPDGHAPPPHSLDYYQSLQFPYAPGSGK